MKFKKLGIVPYGFPSLHVPAEPVTTPEDWDTVMRMVPIMLQLAHSKGVGLAATQVGLNMRFFIAFSRTHCDVFINPEILEYSEDKTTDEEGCLSIPTFRVQVPRSNKIKARWQKPSKEWTEAEIDGFTARVFQHEFDHLNGKTIVDYAPAEQVENRQMLLKRLQKDSRRALRNLWPDLADIKDPVELIRVLNGQERALGDSVVSVAECMRPAEAAPEDTGLMAGVIPEGAKDTDPATQAALDAVLPETEGDSHEASS